MTNAIKVNLLDIKLLPKLSNLLDFKLERLAGLSFTSRKPRFSLVVHRDTQADPYVCKKSHNRAKSKEAFVPPNPKELEIA